MQKQIEKRNAQIETRNIRELDCELRAEKRDNKLYLSGYAVVYGKRSGNLGGFTETIKRGAFDALMKQPDLDVLALFNHDADNILGRTPNTLKLRDDKKGLWMEVELPDNELGRSVHLAVERKDIKGQSFAFGGSKSTWSNDYTEREITHIESLYDVGPVTYPAYTDTNISARDREHAMAEATAQKQKLEKSKMDPKELRAQAQRHMESAEAISAKATQENRELNSDELTQIEEKTQAAQHAIRTAEALEKQAEVRSTLNKTQPAVVTPSEPEVRMTSATQQQRIYMPLNHNLRSFRTNDFGSIQAANDAAYRSGMFFAASIYGYEPAIDYCRQNGISLTRGNSGFRAMGESTNALGGYLVPVETERAVINVTEQYGAALKVCRVHTMMSDKKDVPIRASGLTAYPIGENVEITESQKNWGSAELVARKWGVLAKVSAELTEDSIINVGDDISWECGVAISGSMDNCFLSGTGAGAYHGIVGIQYAIQNNNFSGCLLSAASGHDTLAEIDADDLALLYGSVPEQYQTGAVWMCHPKAKASVFDAILAAAGGNNNANLANGQPATYMGYPIVTSSKFYCPATPSTVANGYVPILFGDFRTGVSLGIRKGITVALSEQRFFEEDAIGIRAVARFDISAHNANCGSAVGPIVGLKLTT
jgi:HK97 family phage major capsid protein/HK97 family phage prohead protease